MDDAFQLLDPRNAQDLLAQFSPGARRKGEEYFRRGRVQDLQVEEAGKAYFAIVNDGRPYEVVLEYETPGGWSGACTCPLEAGCEHIVAAMRALLAENSRAAVRTLSTGGAPASAALAATRGRSAIADSSELVRRLMATRNRPLNREEARFIAKLRTVFARCRQAGRITYWDFDEMGLHFGGYGWDVLHIWPEVPKDEYQFWLYVAHAAQTHQVPIPEFMRPITDTSAIQAMVARWEREREIKQWNQRLSNVEIHAAAPEAAEVAPTDLRLAIEEKEARLQWFRPEQAGFEDIKQRQLGRLNTEYEGGYVQLTPEAELLWQLFAQRVYYSPSPSLRYNELDAERLLGRLLRIPQLNSRIVTYDGRPLARPAEPLRWEVAPAQGEEDDYRFRLIQADGAPAPPILKILPGRPTLYLTPEALFTGPPAHQQVLNPQEETRIPAPAIERPGGVAFLRSLGTELPPGLRDRVRTLPYQITIQCDLRPTYLGSNAEQCEMFVAAEAADGRRLYWTGHGWLEKAPGRARKKPGEDHLITIHDRAMLDALPRLLEPLNPKPAANAAALIVRVTRKFPDTFADWLKSLPPQVKVNLGGELASLSEAAVCGRVKLDVTETDIDWFDLRVVLDVSDTTLTPEETKLLLNAKGSYVRLEGRGWRRLQYRPERRRERAPRPARPQPARTLRRAPAPARPPTRE